MDFDILNFSENVELPYEVTLLYPKHPSNLAGRRTKPYRLFRPLERARDFKEVRIHLNNHE